MDLETLLERTLAGLGYELVDLERVNRGRLLRVFIDKPDGIDVDDCARVSRHFSRLLVTENIDYDRLEISSPGLDRPLKRIEDFNRFRGSLAHVKLKAPVDGRKNFIGILQGAESGVLHLDVDGALVPLDLANVGRARLVPEI